MLQMQQLPDPTNSRLRATRGMLSLQLNFGQSLSLFHTVYNYSFFHPAIQTYTKGMSVHHPLKLPERRLLLLNTLRAGQKIRTQGGRTGQGAGRHRHHRICYSSCMGTSRNSRTRRVSLAGCIPELPVPTGCPTPSRSFHLPWTGHLF